MTLATSTQPFRNLIQSPVGVIENNAHAVVLTHVLVKTSPQGTEVIGSSGDMEVRNFSSSVSSDVATEFTLPGKKADAIFRVIDSGNNITLETDDKASHVRITTETGQYSLATLPAKDYIRIQASEYTQEFNLPADVLQRILSKVAPTMAKLDVRSYLNGTFMEGVGDVVNFVATDGHRMGVYSHPMPSVGKFTALLPHKLVMTLLQRLQSMEGDVKISLSDRFVCFSNGETSLTAKVLDGQYPNYQSVIPEKTNQTATVNLADFKSTLKRVKIMAHQKHHGVALSYSDDEITLTASNGDGEDSLDAVECKSTITIPKTGCNCDYLIEALNVLESPNITLMVEDESRPLQLFDKAIPELTLVVMPTKL